MLEDFSLVGKTALITGGGTGIGLGIADKFVKAGAHVVITGRRGKVLQEVQNQLGDQCSYVVNDIGNLPEIPGLIQKVESEIAPIDILIPNAGVHLKKETLEITDEELDHVLNIHLKSTFALVRECGKSMKERKQGAIIFISSMTGLFGISNVAAYGTAKTAIIGLMRNLAQDLSGFGIRVNTIAPGWILTKMMKEAVFNDEPRKNKILDRTPMKKFGHSEDIGNAAIFLASDAAKFVTGVVLPVDGGASIGF
jgi:NAD(P)-dependent dehydrogenase (short-subunit alcohol dehydrogenase family)